MKNRVALLEKLTRFVHQSLQGGNGSGRARRRRFAFAAVMTEQGGVIVRVFEGNADFLVEPGYPCFEMWTQAQGVATLLNQWYGIDAMDAQQIVVSAHLARCDKKEG